MAAEDGAPLEVCEQCGSPLVDGFCGNCGSGFSDGASPVGAAPLDKSELAKILRRPVGPRVHGSYSLSMQQEEGMAPLRQEVNLPVERFTALPRPSRFQARGRATTPQSSSGSGRYLG